MADEVEADVADQGELFGFLRMPAIKLCKFLFLLVVFLILASEKFLKAIQGDHLKIGICFKNGSVETPWDLK